MVLARRNRTSVSAGFNPRVLPLHHASVATTFYSVRPSHVTHRIKPMIDNTTPMTTPSNRDIARSSPSFGKLARRGAQKISGKLQECIAAATFFVEGIPSTHHWTRDLAFSPGGKRMFLSVGNVALDMFPGPKIEGSLDGVRLPQQEVAA
jgi:hypothetical protein